MIELAAHMQSSEYPTTLRASGMHGLAVGRFSRVATGAAVARAPQARYDRVLCRYCATTIPKASAVAE
eukprot:4838700-Prymnesium_polylepis.1